MTDFNSLPLAEQLKALEPGDELHLRGGGWLPFRKMTGATYPISANGQMWSPAGSFYADTECDPMDIIRVIRPSARQGALQSGVPSARSHASCKSKDR